jgi:hypothetical protein
VGVPPWEAFPEVNRVVVGRVLGQLVERMATALSSPGGGEWGGESAVGTAGRQGPTPAS